MIILQLCTASLSFLLQFLLQNKKSQIRNLGVRSCAIWLSDLLSKQNKNDFSRLHYYLFYDFHSLVEPNETHTNAKRWSGAILPRAMVKRLFLTNSVLAAMLLWSKSDREKICGTRLRIHNSFSTMSDSYNPTTSSEIATCATSDDCKCLQSIMESIVMTTYR